jgi:3D (Asp-Asp-Asp) domain-containing protein/uncharacterized protein YabE (DUF348 family)
MPNIWKEKTMLTLRIWFIRLQKLLNRIDRIRRQHKVWRKHAAISGITLTLSVLTIMFMTGVLFFTNDVLITQDDVTKKFFTMKSDTMEILAEFGYELGEFDRAIHGMNEVGLNSIEIVEGFGVEITVDGYVFTAVAVPGETYYEILALNGIELGEYDVVITGERRINVVRGFGVTVTADGKSVTISALEVGETTVDEILRSADIIVSEGDIINMPSGSAVSQGDEVVVSRVTHRERTYIEEISYETSIEFSNLLKIGYTEITGGVKGESAVKLRETLVDGVVVTSEVLSKEEIKEAETKVISHGMALQVPYSKRDFPEIRLENGIPIDYIAKHTGKATAYTAPPTSGTASGRRLEIGTVAVDPRIIPYGSLLYIMTTCGTRVYGAAIAADTGAFINYNHDDRFVVVDVFMGLTSEFYHEALRWGLRQVDVYVINSGVY